MPNQERNMMFLNNKTNISKNEMPIKSGKTINMNYPRRYEPETPEMKQEKSLFIGLDLGQSQDPTAIAFIECLRSAHPYTGEDTITNLNCIHLQRWKLRTSYPSIVADVVKMINDLEPHRSPDYKPVLAVDATGVGAPVIDLFQRETIKAELRPIQIVGGANVSQEFGITRVPKRDLVSAVQVALQNRTLKIADRLPEADILVRELQDFQVKITDSANDVYGAWREGKHDDLVLAVALALWSANKTPFRVTQQEKDLFQLLAGR
jgi:hypothetical protein